MKKCKTKGCNKQVEDNHYYCSFECACYDGTFSVTKGWLKSVDQIKTVKKELDKCILLCSNCHREIHAAR